jgi:PHP family Zn ribbon phosphoesterase
MKTAAELDEQMGLGPQSKQKVKLVCNECGKKRLVSADGNYNERCPKCGGVDWDVL